MITADTTGARRTTADRPLRAVALGGGHGLHATLSALRLLTDDVTAVVTVADDGGSSGRLRRELGLLPPGDLRMALAALAGPGPEDAQWARLLQHRFGGTGALAGHAVGNLLLAGLMEIQDDPVAALDAVGALLGVHGRVLPMSCEPLDIEAEVSGLDPDRVRPGGDGPVHRIRGQVAVASTPGRVLRVRLRPASPPACAEAVAALWAADVVVLGPGSWFTSVLPHLLVPDLREALLTGPARRVVVLNLVPEPGETAGFSPEQHLAVLAEHAPGLLLDAVVADTGSVSVPDRLHRAAAVMLAPAGRVHLAPVAAHSAPDGTAPGPDGGRGAVPADPPADRHDPTALAAALVAALALPTRVPIPASHSAPRSEPTSAATSAPISATTSAPTSAAPPALTSAPTSAPTAAPVPTPLPAPIPAPTPAPPPPLSAARTQPVRSSTPWP